MLCGWMGILGIQVRCVRRLLQISLPLNGWAEICASTASSAYIDTRPQITAAAARCPSARSIADRRCCTCSRSPSIFGVPRKAVRKSSGSRDWWRPSPPRDGALSMSRPCCTRTCTLSAAILCSTARAASIADIDDVAAAFCSHRRTKSYGVPGTDTLTVPSILKPQIGTHQTQSHP